MLMVIFSLIVNEYFSLLSLNFSPFQRFLVIFFLSGRTGFAIPLAGETEDGNLPTIPCLHQSIMTQRNIDRAPLARELNAFQSHAAGQASDDRNGGAGRRVPSGPLVFPPVSAFSCECRSLLFSERLMRQFHEPAVNAKPRS